MVEKKSLKSISCLSRSDGHLVRRTISSAQKRWMMTILAKIVLAQPTSSKQTSIKIPKRVGERGQPCLTSILHLIFFYHPSLVLNLVMTFSYNLIVMTLNSKGTFSSSNLFHRLFLGTVSKAFLKSTKQHKRLDLSLRHSSTNKKIKELRELVYK